MLLLHGPEHSREHGIERETESKEQTEVSEFAHKVSHKGADEAHKMSGVRRQETEVRIKAHHCCSFILTSVSCLLTPVFLKAIILAPSRPN